jgi:hypothetical protein
MQYFSYISGTLSMNNKLEKAIYEFLETKNRIVIDKSDSYQFRADIIDGILQLNKVHHRCKPRKLSWWQPGYVKTDWHLSDIGFCTFNLYATKN